MSYQKAMALMDKGPSRPTLFKVRLPSTRVSRTTQDYLEFFCTATAIPEVRSNTVAVAGHENMGVVREQPTAIMFGKPLIMTVISDPDYNAYLELRNWLDQCAVNANQAQVSQRMRYYTSFTSDMQIIKLEGTSDDGIIDFSSFSEEGYREVMTANFVNAFPIQLDQINLSTEEQNTMVRFNVAFTYETYTLSGASGGLAGGGFF